MDAKPNFTGMYKPPFISGSDRGSFAAFTLAERFPHIIVQLIRENELDELQVKELGRLREEILYGNIPDDIDSNGVNAVYWTQFVGEYSGYSHYDVPFFVLESYIYYRIAEITRFDTDGLDVFLTSKLGNLDGNTGFIRRLVNRQAERLGVFSSTELRELLFAALWGNSSDLSQLSASKASTKERFRNELLIDDSEALCRFIDVEAAGVQLNYIADNAGLELLTDLLLMDYLLFHGKVPRVVLHVKIHPTFVSDAIRADIEHHLRFLEKMGDRNCLGFAGRIRSYLADSRLAVKTHGFWNTGMHFTKLPSDLKNSLEKGAMLLFKGDANYRRLFEDRMWPMTTPVGDVLNYLPEFRVAYIRTLKSEIMLGLDSEQIGHLNQMDSNWLT
ncbi:MAG: DUF89 family protein, partial [Sphingobacteriales bacterium]